MKSKQLIIFSTFLLIAISAIIYFTAQILSQLSISEIVFIVFSFIALWIVFPFFIRSFRTIVREIRYTSAAKKAKLKSN